MNERRPPRSARVSPVFLGSLLGLALAAGAVLDAEARLWTVRQDGTGDFTAIQSAIDASTSGDVVEVGPGLYSEALVFGGRRIELRSSDGPERTILDGRQLSVSIIQLLFSEARTTRIVGFTMRGGRGTPLSEPASGGAPTPSSPMPGSPPPGAPPPGSPTPDDSRGDAPSEGGLRYGGAVLCNPGSATFENVRFIGNSANRGGAFFSGPGSSPLLVDCFFSGNSAGEGGALASFFSRPILERIEFRDNQAVYGGALWDFEGAITCRASFFEGNTASDGGAGYLRDGTGRGRFDGCTFWRNLGAEAAALRVIHATVDISRSIVAENEFPDFPAAQIHYVDAGGIIERNVFYAGPGVGDLVPVVCEEGGSAELHCNLFWPASPPTSCSPGDESHESNPLFCRPGAGDFSLRPDSPCLPENAPGSCGGFGPLAEPGCESPVLDTRSLGGGLDVQTLEQRKAEPPR